MHQEYRQFSPRISRNKTNFQPDGVQTAAESNAVPVRQAGKSSLPQAMGNIQTIQILPRTIRLDVQELVTV